MGKPKKPADDAADSGAVEGTATATKDKSAKAKVKGDKKKKDERPDYVKAHAARTGREDDVPLSTGRGA